MPPGPAYNWLCVAQSVIDILSNAAAIRAAQVYPKHAAAISVSRRRIRPEVATSIEGGRPAESSPGPKATLDYKLLSSGARKLQVLSVDARPTRELQKDDQGLSSSTNSPIPLTTAVVDPPLTTSSDMNEILSSPSPTALASSIIPGTPAGTREARQLTSSKVPSSRLGRLFHYGGLAASLGYGAASEMLRRSTTSQDQTGGSLMLTEANVKRLVAKLSKMRGAALKLGQFMSIQDTHLLPPEVDQIFRQVQDGAHYMPDWQMEEVMRTSFGSSWADDYFESFDRIPFAAASIGQVHNAVLNASFSPTGKSVPVAVKIQFPNIANSIENDLGYVKMLLTAGRLLPRGLFLDKTIQVMKQELADECDYKREASFLRKFGSDEFLGRDPRFKVPWVWDRSTESVLVMERVEGSSVGGTAIHDLNQRDRDDIATRIIELCLKELFVFRVMQTDPNWTNFLWNTQTRQIELVDFGASREYSKEFIDKWFCLLEAAISGDRDACIEWSMKLGYLTGQETDIMLDAHVKSMMVLGLPFKRDTLQPFAFGPGTMWAEVTAEVRNNIPVMLKHRLTPPPRETYSLNRKLSGAFLLASRLGARVDCRNLWDNVVTKQS